MTDLFISYAREDRRFVQRLHDALANDGHRAWVDWEGIPASAKWMAEVRAAIDEADCFCFVVSPSSVESPVCREEAAHAAASNKRILPLLHQPVEHGLVPETVAAHNWIEFREDDDFDDAFSTLVRALQTEPEHLRSHTRLLVRAKEWEGAGRDRARLLRGSDLTEAETWLGVSAGKDPAPTQLHTAYVLASRKVASRRQRTTIGAVALALVISLVLSAVALVQRSQAQDAQARAEEQQAEAERQRDVARSRELAIASVAAVARDPELAILLASEAVGVQPTPEAEAALRGALAASRIRLAIRDHSGSVTDVAVAPGMQTVFAAGDDGVVRGWDATSGVSVVELDGGDDKAASWVDVSSDGGTVVSVDRGGTVIVWDPSTGAERFRVDGAAAALSPDGRSLAVGSRSGTASVYDVVDGTLIDRFEMAGSITRTPAVSGRAPVHVAFSEDGRRVVLAVFAAASVWDLRSGETVATHGGRDTVTAMAVSPTADVIATGTVFGDVDVWETTRGRTLVEIPPVAEFQPILDIAFGPDGRTIVPVGGAPDVRVRDPATGDVLGTIQGHQGVIFDVEYSPDGSSIATASGDGTVRMWRAPTGNLIAVLPADATGANALAFSDDGHRLATAGEDGSVRVWAASPAGLTVLGQPDGLPPGATFGEGLVAVDPTGDAILTAEPDGSVAVFDAATGADRSNVRALDAPVTFTAWAPEGDVFAAGGADGSVAIVGWPSGQILDVLEHDGTVTVAPFAPTGYQLVVETEPPLVEGGGAVEVAFWSIGSQPMLTATSELTNYMSDLAFTPDGDTVALAVSPDVALFDVGTGELVETLALDREFIRAIAIDPSGGRLAVASTDGHVDVVDMGTGETRYDLTHDDALSDVAFSVEGDRIVTAAGSASIWDATTGEFVRELTEHPGPIDLAGFSPDGRFVWTSGVDVRLFDLESGTLVAVVPLGAPAVDIEYNPVSGDMVGASRDGTSWIFRCEVCGSLDGLLDLARERVTRELSPAERSTYLGEAG